MGEDIYHLSYPHMKCEENSPHGDHMAVVEGFNATDHDQQKSKSGRKCNTHWKDIWDRDHFVDPLGEYGPHTPHGPLPFDQLPDEVVDRVVAHVHGRTYRIRSTDAGIVHAAEVGLERVYVEFKPGNVWTSDDVRHIRAVARNCGIGVTFMSLDTWAGWRRTRRAVLLGGGRWRRIHG